MKLLTKTSLYYLLFSIPILILSGFVCYYVITKEVRNSNDELLLNRKVQVENYIKNNDSISLQFLVKSNEAKINTIKRKQLKSEVFFSDTLILDKKENEMAQNRMITSVLNLKNDTFQIKIWRSTIEFQELIEGIFFLLALIFLFLFLVFMLINFWISKTLWQPFHKTITFLQNFRASNSTIPQFEKTTISEFKTLNKSLAEMMHKMIVDYNNQKKFTENASHEIQTPIAVIKSKIELLLQSKNLNAKEIDQIISIDKACSRIINLNKSLLLLSKIENRQFITNEIVSFKNVINQSLLLFEDYINEDNLKVTIEINEDFLILMNPDLFMILINNLIQNAIRHNIKNGSITITCNLNEFIISNTGIDKPLDSKIIFERFNNNSNATNSIGLGLAISKEIVEISNLKLSYKFISKRHSFTISK